MAEFEEKLNAILSDPQAMGQIASLAQALTGEHTGESAPPPAAEPAEAGPAGEAAGQAGATDWSALLGMLTSCASGIGVVNIDNGFGAACMASKINQL